MLRLHTWKSCLWESCLSQREEDVNVGPRSEQRHREQVMAYWLLAVAAMVFAMVVIGGLTRLTQSGLSMVDWRPVTGWLPPMSEAHWHAVFNAYRQTPEYQHVNAGMTLSEFKGIFWLEFIHRLWGRLIGIAFLVPFVVFLVKGWISRGLAPRLAIAFVLGGLQGVLGWFMVKSGLVDRPDVSQYRLVAHLGAAVAIYGYLLWLGWSLLRPERTDGVTVALRRPAIAVTVLVGLTALAGGFVAGLDAGLVYNTFPLMGGRLVPPELFSYAPSYLGPFEDAASAQFVHRWLALTTLAVILVFWAAAIRVRPPRPVRHAVHGLALVALVQAGLGIATLLLVVPIPLAAAHQAGAIVLFTMALWTVFVLRPQPRRAEAGSSRGPSRLPQAWPAVSRR